MRSAVDAEPGQTIRSSFLSFCSLHLGGGAEAGVSGSERAGVPVVSCPGGGLASLWDGASGAAAGLSAGCASPARLPAQAKTAPRTTRAPNARNDVSRAMPNLIVIDVMRLRYQATESDPSRVNHLW